MDFLPSEIENYSAAHTASENELLRRIDRDTHAKVLKPRMLSGHIQGRFLAMMSMLLQPSSILEIGTYTGYSALCLAEGLVPNGKLTTIDINEELQAMVSGYFSESAFADCIDYRIGNAMDIIPLVHETFDLVFIDADKRNYKNYYNLVIDKVRSGGLIIVDNVLWSGKVAQENIPASDKETHAMIEFNQMVHLDPRVFNLLLPLRDGLMLLRKK